MAWAKNGSTTLSSAGDDLSITDLTANKTNLFLVHTLPDSGQIANELNFGYTSIDTGNNYSSRYASNGINTSRTSQNDITLQQADYGNALSVIYAVNIATKEKLTISFQCETNSTGAGSAPSRTECVGKWANTSNQFDNVRITNWGAGDYGSGANLSVLGSELTPASATTIETGSIYIDTDINGRWWYDGTNWNMQPTYDFDFSSSTGWTQVGTAIVIDATTDNRVEFTNLPRNAEHKVYYNLPSALSDSQWILDAKINISASSTSGYGFVGIALVDSSNEIHTGTVDALIINLFDNNGAGNDLRLRSLEYNAGSLTGSGNSNALSFNTDYYVRLIRTSTTNMDLYVYSDSLRTTQIGTTLSKTINASTGALDVLQLTSQNVSDSGTLSGIIDDVKIYNGVTSVQE